ncbi:MAG: hypothetical protein DME97_05060 [Verrucomicrobia bacterium]|nr:MAG: hypothetical protein DME97_05060 [Verrucomicrobiota bacterium]
MGAWGRFIFVIVLMAAWFSISNHCALGALIALKTKTRMAGMHCHGTRPAPSKPGEEQTPCCKVLKALTIAKVDTGAAPLDFVLKNYPASELLEGILHEQAHTVAQDTGPPGALSFSESVLQRSILAHAPPSLA